MTCIAELDEYSEFFFYNYSFYFVIFLLCGLFQTGFAPERRFDFPLKALELRVK